MLMTSVLYEAGLTSSSRTLEGLLGEGTISPREKEAALQMKRLHRGIGTTLQVLPAQFALAP